MKDALIRELQAQHLDPPNYMGELTQRAAQEILRLRAEISRMQSDRPYIIGFNAGYEAAEEHAKGIVRCAECDCENGGSDCNWMKPGPSEGAAT